MCEPFGDCEQKRAKVHQCQKMCHTRLVGKACGCNLPSLSTNHNGTGKLCTRQYPTKVRIVMFTIGLEGHGWLIWGSWFHSPSQCTQANWLLWWPWQFSLWLDIASYLISGFRCLCWKQFWSIVCAHFVDGRKHEMFSATLTLCFQQGNTMRASQQLLLCVWESCLVSSFWKKLNSSRQCQNPEQVTCVAECQLQSTDRVVFALQHHGIFPDEDNHKNYSCQCKVLCHRTTFKPSLSYSELDPNHIRQYLLNNPEMERTLQVTVHLSFLFCCCIRNSFFKILSTNLFGLLLFHPDEVGGNCGNVFQDSIPERCQRAETLEWIDDDNTGLCFLFQQDFWYSYMDHENNGDGKNNWGVCWMCLGAVRKLQQRNVIHEILSWMKKEVCLEDWLSKLFSKQNFKFLSLWHHFDHCFLKCCCQDSNRKIVNISERQQENITTEWPPREVDRFISTDSRTYSCCFSIPRRFNVFSRMCFWNLWDNQTCSSLFFIWKLFQQHILWELFWLKQQPDVSKMSFCTYLSQAKASQIETQITTVWYSKSKS